MRPYNRYTYNSTWIVPRSICLHNSKSGSSYSGGDDVPASSTVRQLAANILCTSRRYSTTAVSGLPTIKLQATAFVRQRVVLLAFSRNVPRGSVMSEELKQGCATTPSKPNSVRQT